MLGIRKVRLFCMLKCPFVGGGGGRCRLDYWFQRCGKSSPISDFRGCVMPNGKSIALVQRWRLLVAFIAH